MSYYEVKAQWDAQAEVWVASSDDIPGLNTEAETFDALVEKVLAIAPELIELNHVQLPGHGHEIKITATRRATLDFAAA